MKTFWIPLVITLGFWTLSLSFLLFLSRSVLLVRKLLFHLILVAVAAGLFFLMIASPEAVSPDLRKILQVALVLALSWAGARVLGFLIFARALRNRDEARLPPLIRAVIMGIVYVASLVLILKIAYPELSLTGFLVGSTVFSAIVGLALQDILINFLSGMALSVEKPFQINDWVMVGGKEGKVTGITWRSTKLRMRDNNLLVIPNSIIAREIILNFNHPSKLHRRSVRVGVGYQHPPRLVVPALLEAVRRVKTVMENPAPQVLVTDFSDFSIIYDLRYWLPDYENVPDVASLVRCEVYEVLKKRGIKIPFPIRDVYLYRGARPTPRAQLTVTEGWKAGEAIEVGPGETTIGRDPANTLVVGDPMVSKKHARIVSRPDGLVIEDLGSKVGTLVNGVPVKEHQLRSGDEIRIGATVFFFESGG